MKPSKPFPLIDAKTYVRHKIKLFWSSLIGLMKLQEGLFWLMLGIANSDTMFEYWVIVFSKQENKRKCLEETCRRFSIS